MKVLFIAAESSPFVKTGGLGDVIGALPKSLNDNGVETRVVIPLYSNIDRDKYNIKFLKYIFVDVGWKHIYCGLFSTVYNGVTYYFIDNEQYFNRSSVYGQSDDGERFAFFSKAALEIMPHIDFQADVINANDWHTALSIVYLDLFKRNNSEYYKDIKSVLSIHNIEFQGKYDPYELGNLFGLGHEYLDVLRFDNCINLLKGGIQLADRVNTVSDTYANEILTPYYSFGLDSILNVERFKLRGIVNGLDYDKFNPETDLAIFENYDLESINKKANNKLALQRELGLKENVDIPIISMVTRLTDQKGINLVCDVADLILNMGIQLIILGTGDSYYENRLRELEYDRNDKFRGIIAFNNELSSKIYASSDLYLMPSKAEPCGLSQLIAMSYGTVPIVHRVGGLRDTVEPYNPVAKTGRGFTFESFNAFDMLDAIRRSLDVLFNDKESWSLIVSNAMNCKFNWSNSAQKYIEMYNEI